MNQAQPDHTDPIQQYLLWEASAGRIGTLGSKNDSTAPYITPRDLKNYLTEERVKAIFQALLPDKASIVDYVLRFYLRGLAILLSIGAGRMIEQFIEKPELQDKRVPFSSRPMCFPQSAGNPDLYEDFAKRQWRYCPGEMIYTMRGEICPHLILPFRVKEQIGRGVSSTVHRIEVTQDQDLNTLQHPTDIITSDYVLKTYQGRDADHYFQVEKAAFERLHNSYSRPKNLIGFHGSFVRKEGKRNLILEFADGGTLKELMEKAPPSRGEEILECWKSLSDLLLALHTLHEAGGRGQSGFSFMSGWHQDVKPNNILVKRKKDPNSIFKYDFLLADLGHSHFKASGGHGLSVKDKDTFGTRAYGAPEVYRMDQSEREVSMTIANSVDMWSLGCVLSEVAVWIGLGQQRLEQYQLHRSEEVTKKLSKPGNGDLFHDGEKKLDTVTVYHDAIHNSHRIDDFITLRVVNDVVDDMLEHRDVRSEPLFARRKMLKAISAAEVDLKKREVPGPESRPTSSNRELQSPFGRSHEPVFLDYEQIPSSSPHRHASEKRIKPSGILPSIPDSSIGGLDIDEPPQGRKLAKTILDIQRMSDRPEGRHTGTPYDIEDIHLDHEETTLLHPNMQSNGLSKRKEIEDRPRPKELTLHEGLKWKQEVKDFERRKRPGPTPELPGAEQLLTLLRDRDHIFIIDNSESMAAHAPNVKRVIGLHGYILKKCDPTGLDIHFTNSPVQKNTKKTSDLLRAIEGVNFAGLTNMEARLGTILREHKSRFGGKVAVQKSFFKLKAKEEDQRPISFYIFTDGRWQPGNRVDLVIRDVVSAMQAKSLLKGHVAIQFIRFGDNPDGIAILDNLDHGLGLEKMNMDIVDHESWDANVWKQLLGALDTFYDGDFR